MKDAELQLLNCDRESAAGDERDVATTSGGVGPFSPPLHHEWEKANQHLLFLRKLQGGDITLMTFFKFYLT